MNNISENSNSQEETLPTLYIEINGQLTPIIEGVEYTVPVNEAEDLGAIEDLGTIDDDENQK
jgi:hypothetical protein